MPGRALSVLGESFTDKWFLWGMRNLDKKEIQTLPDTGLFARVLLPSCVQELLCVGQGRLQ